MGIEIWIGITTFLIGTFSVAEIIHQSFYLRFIWKMSSNFKEFTNSVCLFTIVSMTLAVIGLMIAVVLAVSLMMGYFDCNCKETFADIIASPIRY